MIGFGIEMKDWKCSNENINDKLYRYTNIKFKTLGYICEINRNDLLPFKDFKIHLQDIFACTLICAVY